MTQEEINEDFSLPDLTSLSQEQKDLFINGIMENTAKHLHTVYLALGLELGMKCEFTTEVGRFKLDFTKIE